MKKIRCAIYTRKSSEDGLEQEFNSLHAQREACAAYVASQKHEGWVLLQDAYDDGGCPAGASSGPRSGSCWTMSGRAEWIRSSSTRLTG